MSLFKKKAPSHLGIDIGTSSLKIVELTREKEYLRLLTYGEFRMPGSKQKENIIYKSSLELEDKELANILKDLIRASQVESREATFSVSVFSSFFTLIDLPMMSEKELAQAISFQARKYIPVPISEVVLDWSIVENKKSGDQSSAIQVILVAVPKEVVNKYARIAEMADIQLKALEMETFSLARALIKKNEKNITLIVDLGAGNTNVCIVDGGIVRVNHNFDIAGRDLTKALSRSLNLDWLRAEEIKKELGLKIREGEISINQILTPLLDNMASEIQRILNLYHRRHGKRVEKIILAGGEAGLPGIVDYFVEKFSKEVEVADPFSQIAYPAVLTETIKEIGPAFSVAIGLARRGVQ